MLVCSCARVRACVFAENSWAKQCGRHKGTYLLYNSLADIHILTHTFTFTLINSQNQKACDENFMHFTIYRIVMNDDDGRVNAFSIPMLLFLFEEAQFQNELIWKSSKSDTHTHTNREIASSSYTNERYHNTYYKRVIERYRRTNQEKSSSSSSLVSNKKP